MRSAQPASYRSLQLISMLLATLQLSLTIRQHVELKSYLFLIDTDVYARAITRYLEGGNAYDLSIKPRFVYHPIFLQIFGLAGTHAKDLLLFLYTLSGVLFLNALANRKETLYPFFLAFCYSGVGFDQLMGGHLTLPLHFLLLTPLIQGLLTSRQLNSYIVLVAITSLIKPYMLAYLLIPVITSFRQSLDWPLTLRNSIFAVFGLGLIIGIDYECNPELTRDFLETLHQQTLVDGDLGQGFFYAFFKLTHNTAWALMLHALAVMLLCGPVLYLLWRDSEQGEDSIIFYLYFFLTMVNPRLKEYDLAAALIAIFISWSFIKRNKITDLLLSVAFGVSGLRLVLLFKQHENPMVAISGFAFYATIAILTMGFLYSLTRETQTRLRLSKTLGEA